MELFVGLIGFGLLLAVITLVLPIVSFVRARRAVRIAEELRGRVASLERTLDALIAAGGSVEPPIPSPVPLAPPAQPDLPIAPPPARAVVPAAESAGAATPTELDSFAPATSPPLPPAPPLPPDMPATSTADGLEQMIGGSWLLYAGIAAVVLGMSYFVKFAFDNGWISEQLRVVAGLVTGLVLVAAGVRFWSRGLALFGQALAGGGVVVLYVSIYSALHFYSLIGPTPAFALMVTITAGAAYLADRQRSQPLAALALLGGFATPMLVGGRQDSQVVLFTYMAILISGTAVIARRHAWPLLSAASYLCTFVLVVAWSFEWYEAHKWFRTELFLTLYIGLFGYLLRTLLAARDRTVQGQLAVAALATAPLTYHLASLLLLNLHPAAWLAYLVLFTVAGLVVSQRTRAAWLRVLALLLVGLPAMAWVQSLMDPRWYLPAIATSVVIYALHLTAQWEAAGEEGAGGDVRLMQIVHAQANGLLLPLTLYVFLEDRFAWWSPTMVAALSAWNGGLALVLRRRAPRMRLQFVTLCASLAATALVLQFDGPVVAVGWAAEGVLVGWLARRERSRPLALGSAALIGMGAWQLAVILSGPFAASALPLVNARALAALLVVALLAWLAYDTRQDPSPQVTGTARHALIVLANLLALGLLSAEIHAYFSQRVVDAELAGDFRAAGAANLAEQVTLSVSWALYAVGLIAAGIRRRYAPARYLAIILFAVTVLKVLLNDIAGLDRLNRMLSVLGVGILLLVASYLYQRMAATAGRKG